MKTPLLAAALLLLASGAFADAPTPAPGTWGFGVQGFGRLYDNFAPQVTWGQPSVRYQATDKLALELIPALGLSREHTSGGGVSLQNYYLAVDVIQRLASYKSASLAFVVEPEWAYSYGHTDVPAVGATKAKTSLYGLGAGFEVEYFARPYLSFGARALYRYEYATSESDSPIFVSRSASHSLFLAGQALTMRYYFTGTGAEEKAELANGAGAWALGWQGTGGLYGDAAPSIKYVLSDRTALELIPNINWFHTAQTNSVSNFEAYGVNVGVVRKISTLGPVTLSWLIEPGLSRTHGRSEIASFITPLTTESRSWDLSLGGGLEMEYFVLPNLSLGARGLLVYAMTRNSAYAQTGYTGLQLTNSLMLAGQVLSARLYFGGGH